MGLHTRLYPEPPLFLKGQIVDVGGCGDEWGWKWMSGGGSGWVVISSSGGGEGERWVFVYIAH